MVSKILAVIYFIGAWWAYSEPDHLLIHFFFAFGFMVFWYKVSRFVFWSIRRHGERSGFAQR
ncbi:hypothetical protein ACLMYS_003844 [Salmonella enterica]